jgi:hypothetical protein
MADIDERGHGMTNPASKKPAQAEIPTKKQKQQRRKEKPADSELDSALEETFPASDPVAVTQRMTLNRAPESE